MKNTWTNLLDSDWFYHNQAGGMLIERSGNSLELFVKQLVTQPRLASSISVGQAMFDGRKTKCCYLQQSQVCFYPTRVIQDQI